MSFTDYRFIELSLPCRDAAVQERFWTGMFGAKVIFRGKVLGQPFTRMQVCGISLLFREDPEYVPPPGPGEEHHYRFHLGLRVHDLDKSITELEARGARFVVTPERLRQLQAEKGAGGDAWQQTDYIAPPLTRERIDAGELRHDVAILVAPDNLWVELNQIEEPADTRWYPGS